MTRFELATLTLARPWNPSPEIWSVHLPGILVRERPHNPQSSAHFDDLGLTRYTSTGRHGGLADQLASSQCLTSDTSHRGTLSM